MLRLTHDALRRLIIETARNILSAPLRKLEEIGSARLIGALMDDVGVISGGMMAAFTLILNSAVMFGCVAFLGFASHWSIVLLLILTVCTLSIYNWISRTAAARMLKEGQTVRNLLFSHFQALTHGIKELKLNRERRRAFISEDLEPTARHFEHLDLGANIVYFGAGAWSDLLLFGALGLVVFVLPRINFLDRSDTIPVALVLLYLMSPLAAIATVFPRMERASVVLQDLKSLGLELAAIAESEPESESLDALAWKRLRLRDLTFRYQNDQAAFVVGPLDVSFDRG